MAATAKYLFDNDFGGGTAAKPVIALADHAAKIAQVEAEAYRNGYAAAEAKAQAEAKRDTAAMLAKIATGLDETRRRLSTLETRLEAEAIEIAIATIEDAPFLGADQKRDIFYNNAARFLRLNDREIAGHRRQ